LRNVLEKILEAKRLEVEVLKARMPAEELARRAEYRAPVRAFREALIAAKPPAVIAELKKASPSAGLLRADFSIEKLCAAYMAGGAAALSVLTEKNFFLCALENLVEARRISPLPLLRKDFIFDAYQVYESRATGADCILLIAAALEKPLLEELAALARSVGLETLVEVHDEEDIEKASGCGADVIGVNNRNLKTLEVNINTSIALAEKIPAGVCRISESGIKTREDVRRLLDTGYTGVLVGQSLVTADDPAARLRELIS